MLESFQVTGVGTKMLFPPHLFLPILPELVANFPSLGITSVPQISIYKCSGRELAVDIYGILKGENRSSLCFVKRQYN